MNTSRPLAPSVTARQSVDPLGRVGTRMALAAILARVKRNCQDLRRVFFPCHLWAGLMAPAFSFHWMRYCVKRDNICRGMSLSGPTGALFRHDNHLIAARYSNKTQFRRKTVDAVLWQSVSCEDAPTFSLMCHFGESSVAVGQWRAGSR